jgi:outer membrane protein assembly factor BamB
MTKVTDMLFVAFKARVVALDKHTGKKIWAWKSKNEFGGYVGLLLDAERLYVSVDGYTTCLDALTGKERWHNPLKGMGVGVPSLAMAGYPTSYPIGQAAHHSRSQSGAAGAAAASS